MAQTLTIKVRCSTLTALLLKDLPIMSKVTINPVRSIMGWTVTLLEVHDDDQA